MTAKKIKKLILDAIESLGEDADDALYRVEHNRELIHRLAVQLVYIKKFGKPHISYKLLKDKYGDELGWK